MTTEELPANLDKLKITPTYPVVKSVKRNPFYNLEDDFKTSHTTNCEPILSVKHKMIHRWKCRPRRRSESCLENCTQEKSSVETGSFDLTSPPSYSHGVTKPAQRKNVAPTKKYLFRQPILKTLFGCEQGRSLVRSHNMFLVNSEKKTTSQIQPKNSNFNISDPCSFRDLINECDILLSQTKKSHSGNIRHESNNCSKYKTTSRKKEINCKLSIKERNASTLSASKRSLSVSVMGTTCSQQACYNTTTTSNCDDVTISELASYFDTMVHIPKKMSSMAEMMYI